MDESDLKEISDRQMKGIDEVGVSMLCLRRRAFIVILSMYIR
jgi:hypothetical protein